MHHDTNASHVKALKVASQHLHAGLQIIDDLIPFLKPGGVCIMTMKMVGIGRDRSGTFNKLSQFFEVSEIV